MRRVARDRLIGTTRKLPRRTARHGLDAVEVHVGYVRLVAGTFVFGMSGVVAHGVADGTPGTTGAVVRTITGCLALP